MTSDPANLSAVADRNRAFEFLNQLATRSATSVVPVSGGVGVLNFEWPFSYANNQLRLVAPGPPDVVAAEADRVLGGAGLRHRAIEIEGDIADPAWLSHFRSLGYEVLHTVVMRQAGPSSKKPTAKVEEANYVELAPLVGASWRSKLPWLEDAVIDQLVWRRNATARACALTHLAVREGEAIASYCDLYRIGKVANIESVETVPRFRGRGYATSVVLDAAKRARAAGCDLVFLLADRADWPQELYRRLGFEEIGAQTILELHPSATTPRAS